MHLVGKTLLASSVDGSGPDCPWDRLTAGVYCRSSVVINIVVNVERDILLVWDDVLFETKTDCSPRVLQGVVNDGGYYAF